MENEIQLMLEKLIFKACNNTLFFIKYQQEQKNLSSLKFENYR
jgi:hypothetical protein